MEDSLKSVLAGVLNLQSENVGEDLTCEQTPEWDSLNHLRLITALETEFDVKFSMEDIPRLTSFRAILDELRSRRKQ